MQATRHSLHFEDKKYVLHTIPSGIFREGSINIIGNGVVIDPVILSEEIAKLEKDGVDVQGKLLISKKAHLILPTHRIIDAASEASKGKTKIGSTLKGIGPTYMDKTGRNGLRVQGHRLGRIRERYGRLKEKHRTAQTIRFPRITTSATTKRVACRDRKPQAFPLHRQRTRGELAAPRG